MSLPVKGNGKDHRVSGQGSRCVGELGMVQTGCSALLDVVPLQGLCFCFFWVRVPFPQSNQAMPFFALFGGFLGYTY